MERYLWRQWCQLLTIVLKPPVVPIGKGPTKVDHHLFVLIAIGCLLCTEQRQTALSLHPYTHRMLTMHRAREPSIITYTIILCSSKQWSFHPYFPVIEILRCRCLNFYRLLENTEEAIKSLTRAVDILRNTHGTSTPFMKDLLAKLEEAHAEASYKLSSTDD